ncbi:MAG: hypothetical protein QOJ03_3094, partial [Frankiaceae bacterium]|nr:hypothetical protein [Frankiaceae bacterium]
MAVMVEAQPRLLRLASRLSNNEWRRLGGMFGFIV